MKAPRNYRKELVELLYEQPYSKIEFVIDKLGVERKAVNTFLESKKQKSKTASLLTLIELELKEKEN